MNISIILIRMAPKTTIGKNCGDSYKQSLAEWTSRLNLVAGYQGSGSGFFILGGIKKSKICELKKSKKKSRKFRIFVIRFRVLGYPEIKDLQKLRILIRGFFKISGIFFRKFYVRNRIFFVKWDISPKSTQSIGSDFKKYF